MVYMHVIMLCDRSVTVFSEAKIFIYCVVTLRLVASALEFTVSMSCLIYSFHTCSSNVQYHSTAGAEHMSVPLSVCGHSISSISFQNFKGFSHFYASSINEPHKQGSPLCYLSVHPSMTDDAHIPWNSYIVASLIHTA